ncbi:Chaperone protein dnaJ 15 [Camellia lanceoleosa]|uniref:Chaperone protein dnaJ 15 n=1 Tax=Camellia lanceoleosa TaxID=1840588 RepID=A0ACC0G8E5_9ERIC|nr:Chaperone protein dnaJ 15 [Camellia lanceoleosa]
MLLFVELFLKAKGTQRREDPKVPDLCLASCFSRRLCVLYNTDLFDDLNSVLVIDVLTWYELEEDSEKTGKVTSAGMYFLHFQVHRMNSTLNALAMAKDPEAAFFKRLEGLQPCEVRELKAGTHIFAVYGDNFFKTASYFIETLCAKSYEDTTHKLKDIEAQILMKRTELRQFEAEYRKALARFQEVTNRYTQEKQSVDELLKQRDTIHSSFAVVRSVVVSSGSDTHVSNGSSSKVPGEDFKAESPGEDGGSDGKDKSSKKKWFNLNLKGSDKKFG